MRLEIRENIRTASINLKFPDSHEKKSAINVQHFAGLEFWRY